MKNTFMAGIALAGILSWSSGAEASSFTGFSETGDVFFNDFADFDYDPFFLGGAVFDFFGLVNIALAPDLGAGSLLLTDGFLADVLVGALVDTALHADGGASDDSFSMLFDLTTGPTDYAIATFTGDLDGAGTTDFFTDGVVFAPGTLSIVGARQDAVTPIPLPAGLPLLLGAFGVLALARRKRIT